MSHYAKIVGQSVFPSGGFNARRCRSNQTHRRTDAGEPFVDHMLAGTTFSSAVRQATVDDSNPGINGDPVHVSFDATPGIDAGGSVSCFSAIYGWTSPFHVLTLKLPAQRSKPRRYDAPSRNDTRASKEYSPSFVFPSGLAPITKRERSTRLPPCIRPINSDIRSV
ncbi:MAG: hypothetical protein QOK37_2592 [Thermoanaerobaculia bacterium]|jgi:hypothetical protein|nr:hypothetical protein [Thermoanaerobaculia bacterium]